MINRPTPHDIKVTPLQTLLPTDQSKRYLLAQELIATLEELILAQKKLNYFSKELKVWSTPKRHLPQI